MGIVMGDWGTPLVGAFPDPRPCTGYDIGALLRFG